MTLQEPTSVEIPDLARVALANIRLFNGALALLAPKFLIRRLGGNPETQGTAIYAFRMFGIRTVLLGVELFVLQGERREEALRTAVLIHASDTTSAFIALVAKQLPRKAAVTAVVISAVNTCLAIVARRRAPEVA